MVNRFAPKFLPYDRLVDTRVGEAIEKYYTRGELPADPLLVALLERRDIAGMQNSYSVHPADIHRWILHWMPSRAWGSHKKVDRWVKELQDT